jgi:1,4-dihydroxy-6-naphthoate synthase
VHAQEMSGEIMRSILICIWNAYSLDLGEGGKKAIMKFLDVYRANKPGAVFSETGLFVQ